MSRALRLIQLAFRLQLLVTHRLACGVFEGTLRLIGNALNVFQLMTETPWFALDDKNNPFDPHPVPLSRDDRSQLRKVTLVRCLRL